MYKTASQYLGPSKDEPMIMKPYRKVEPARENFQFAQSVKPIPKPTPSPVHHNKHNIDMKWEKKRYNNFHDPRVWGPAFWFSLHVSALNYPEKPSPIFRERMKGRILAIPYEIPCPACKPHASAFIEQNKSRLDEIVSNRQNLFNFYVDFHNKVNERYNKKKYSYQEAWDLYSGAINVYTLQYN